MHVLPSYNDLPPISALGGAFTTQDSHVLPPAAGLDNSRRPSSTCVGAYLILAYATGAVAPVRVSKLVPVLS